MTSNWKELITLLKSVLEKDGIEIIRSIMDRIFEIHNLPKGSETIQKIEDLTEVKSMLETNTKNWENAVFEKGIEKGIEKGVEKGIGIGAENMQIQMVERMAKNGMANSDIRKITGLSLARIAQIRKKIHH